MLKMHNISQKAQPTYERFRKKGEKLCQKKLKITLMK